jgi:glycosyltransferase involved in cell wall biosynthesis
MKILKVVGGNLDEGAAKGASLLHDQLRSSGIDSTLITNSWINTDQTGIHSVAESSIGKRYSVLRMKLDNFYKMFYEDKQGLKFSPGLFGANIVKTQAYEEADIVHLHWICNGFISINQISKIDKPIVWTLRDMWPLTGGCHHSLGCDKFQTTCGSCPQLGSERKRDLSTFLQKRKERCYSNKITFVGISNWITDQAKKSRLLGNSKLEMIPNNIDLKSFYPSDKNEAKRFFNLSSDKPVLLFGAQYLKSIYKGYDILLDLLNVLDENVRVIYFGRQDTEELKQLTLDTTYLGFLSTEEMRMAYTAADLFISTSRVESLSKTVAESMACGTPVVCFDQTSSADIVDHKKNGYLAQPFRSDEFLTGIKYVLNHADSKKLSENAVEKAKMFDAEKISRKYIELYSELLGDR